MINAGLLYALGARGIYIEIRGGVVLTLAFALTIQAKWARRANRHAMTMAEWMAFRFGDGLQGRIARMVNAGAVLLETAMAVSFFAIGAGKFVGTYLNIPPLAAATIMIGMFDLSRREGGGRGWVRTLIGLRV